MVILNAELTSSFATCHNTNTEEHDIIYVDAKTSYSFMSTDREYLLSRGGRDLEGSWVSYKKAPKENLNTLFLDIYECRRFISI